MLVSLLLASLSLPQTGLPDLPTIFMEKNRSALAKLLSPTVPVKTDLRPLLYDYGRLDPQQVLMAFDKLQHRFQVTEVVLSNSQSDTNFAWLEIHLDLRLIHRKSGLVTSATFAFQLKAVAARLAVSRWVLQDMH